MKQTPVKKASRKKKSRRAGPLCWLIAFVVAAAFLFFLYELISLAVLPLTYLIIILIATMLLTGFVLFFWLLKTRRPVTRLLFGILAVALGIVYGLGGSFMRETGKMLSDVTNLTDKVSNVVSVYGLISNGIEKPEHLDQGSLGVVSELDPQGTEGIIRQLENQGVHVTPVEYEDPYSLVAACISGEVTAIALPEQFHDAVNEAANDDNKLNVLTTVSNIVDQYIYYTDRTEIQTNRPNPVANVMTDPFVVLISGNDSYGTLSSASRSDVNMLAAINPNTAQVLLVSLPRDTYMPITCKKNPSACSAVAGEEDKLTHSGIYGISATESSIEDFLDIEINYSVRVNFSSLINIVDAAGGVTVNVEPGLEVDTFYSNGTEGVHAGENHLNGERALAFARERYAYVDGDNQRVRNQQILIKALIKQMMSPDMVVKYPDVIRALSTAFETNMSAREIKALITLEITRFPNWNIQSYALDNEPDSRYSPAAGSDAAVTIADPAQVAEARSLIETVLKGGVPEVAAQQSAGTVQQTPAETQESQKTETEYYREETYNPYNGEASQSEGVRETQTVPQGGSSGGWH